jgi:hypothetical protein
MSLSYHPLHLAGVFVHSIVVHRGLALPVCPIMLRDNSELVGRPVAAELAPGLRILNQPIDPPLEGAAPWLDRSHGPRWASSPTSTPV